MSETKFIKDDFVPEFLYAFHKEFKLNKTVFKYFTTQYFSNKFTTNSKLSKNIVFVLGVEGKNVMEYWCRSTLYELATCYDDWMDEIMTIYSCEWNKTTK